MTESKPMQVDVAEIIRAKSPRLAKKMPRFVVNFLRRLVHEKDVNEILAKANGATGIDFVNIGVESLELKRQVSGMENIPSEGRFIFVANHPLGGLESLMMMKTINEKYSDFMFVVNDFLMALEPLRPIFIPINKVGKQSRTNAEQLNELYASDKQVLYFPAGLCSRKIKGKIVDLPWQKNFIVKAVEYQRDIIPIYIGGKNSNFFYRLANWRKRLKIKFNIEMLFLVDEMFKQRGQTITLTIGKPIPYATFDKSKTPMEWAEWVKTETYKMNNG
ncbi:MAG: 1-acyl-sn-glycerol-3-phosphate acyltransferase [Bacteroidales bacterium]|nr:1-acyl-sn-glycerol-3-phosphate acyltransferase [Bacteroidales bacterium]MBQ4476548.1 1-acyl-sn-glycerol-3-phosphate acyltransferase [Bacteroidales bacterium]